MITDYRVLTATKRSIDDQSIAIKNLEEQVADAISKGWQPFGAMSTVLIGSMYHYYQPIVGYKMQP